MHCPKATGELLYALHRVVLEGREPPLKQAGVLGDSEEYMALLDEQMLVYVDLVGDARIVQLLVRALDAHPEDERVAYIGASALGELYGPQWAGMVVGAEAFAKAGLRVDMQDEGGARALARALVRHGGESKYVRLNALAAFEVARSSSVRVKALLRAEGAAAALADALLKDFENACECCNERGKGFMFCAACMQVAYCSRACQRSHWGEHKAACRAAGGRGE